MMTTQLISGRIADFIPIGQDGQPIYLNAEAFRAALAITPLIGEDKVKCLAIPKIRADGQNIDWYVPFPPPSNSSQYHIVSWAKATAAERSKALAILDGLEQSLKRLGQDLTRRAGDSKSMLFAHYLTGQNAVQNLPAIHFPGPEYIYIVDGVPVITFWGFSAKNDNLANSPFHLLRHPELVPAAPAAAAATSFVATAPVAAAAATEPEPSQDKTYPVVAQKSGFPKWLLWAIPLMLLLLWIFLWLLPHLGLYGEQVSIFDDRYDPPVKEEVTADSRTVKQQNSNSITSTERDIVTRDHGILPEQVPNKVDELQETTDPEEVRELLDAPDLASHANTNTNSSNSSHSSTSNSRYESERNVNVNTEYHIIDERDPNAASASHAPNVVTDSSSSTVTDVNSDSSYAYSGDYSEQVDINTNREVLLNGGQESLGGGDGADGGDSFDSSSYDSSSSTNSNNSYDSEYAYSGTSSSNNASYDASEEADGAVGTDQDRGHRLGSLPPVDPFGDDGDAAFAQEQSEGSVGQDRNDVAGVGRANGADGVDDGNKPNRYIVPKEERESLSFTAESLAQKGAAMFDGNWIARSGLMDSISGKPLQLSYQVSDGVGQAVVHRSDKVKCVTDIGLEAKGNTFSIVPTERARCPDKTTYRLPNVQCEADSKGQVKCWGSYANRRFPIRLYRE